MLERDGATIALAVCHGASGCTLGCASLLQSVIRHLYRRSSAAGSEEEATRRNPDQQGQGASGARHDDPGFSRARHRRRRLHRLASGRGARAGQPRHGRGRPQHRQARESGRRALRSGARGRGGPWARALVRRRRGRVPSRCAGVGGALGPGSRRRRPRQCPRHRERARVRAAGRSAAGGALVVVGSVRGRRTCPDAGDGSLPARTAPTQPASSPASSSCSCTSGCTDCLRWRCAT